MKRTITSKKIASLATIFLFFQSIPLNSQHPVKTISLTLAPDATFRIKKNKLDYTRIVINGTKSKGGREHIEIDEAAYLRVYDKHITELVIQNVHSVVMHKYSFFSEFQYEEISNTS